MTTRNGLSRTHRIHFVLFLCALSPVMAGCLAPDAVPGDSGAAGGPGGPDGSLPGYAPVWARSYGNDEDADKRIFAVAAAADGGAVIGGDFESNLQMGSLSELPWADSRDAFVAVLDKDGAPKRAFALGGWESQRIWSVQSTAAGMLVAGSHSGQLLINGNDENPAPDGRGGFVALINDDGSLAWIVRVDGQGDQSVYSIALAPTGDIFIGGTFQNGLTVGDLDTSEQADGWQDFFVAKLDSAGKPLWAKSLGGDPADVDWWIQPCFVAAAPDGGVHVAGSFNGTMRFQQDVGAAGDRDAFLGKLDASGAPVSGLSVGTAGSTVTATGLAAHSTGLVAFSGDLQGKAQYGGTVLQSDGEEADAMVALFSSLGKAVWARRVGSSAGDHGGPVTFDSEGNVLFSGRFRGSFTFGNQAVIQNSEAEGADDIFLATLSAGGEPLHNAAYGEWDYQYPAGMAATADGQILLGGWFGGGLDFGAGTMEANGGADMFIAKLKNGE